MIRTKLIAQVIGAGCTIGAVWFAGAVTARAEQPQVSGGMGPGRPMLPMGQGGGGFFAGSASVAVDGDYLYIVRGSEVLKMRKADLVVAMKSELPPMPVSQFRGGGIQMAPPPAGGFGGGGGGFGGGGGGTPPPKQNL